MICPDIYGQKTEARRRAVFFCYCSCLSLFAQPSQSCHDSRHLASASTFSSRCRVSSGLALGSGTPASLPCAFILPCAFVRPGTFVRPGAFIRHTVCLYILPEISGLKNSVICLRLHSFRCPSKQRKEVKNHILLSKQNSVYIYKFEEF